MMHRSLQSMNSFAVDASAENLFYIKDLKDIKQWIKAQGSEAFLILGGGSNVLFVKDPEMAVLKNELKGIQVLEERDSELILEVCSGENWPELVQYTVEQGWGGLENLALIPGSVGAAPVQNIGAYGVELKDRMLSLEYVDMRSAEIKELEAEECQFGYRDSIFKRDLKNTAFITKVRFRLTKKEHDLNFAYAAIEQYFEKNSIVKPTIRDVFDAVVSIRTQKLPDPKELGNAGSFFKNPLVSLEIYNRLALEYPSMPFYPAGEQRVKLAAAWLIDKAGWKGKRIGQVGTYEKQALVIVNHGNATGLEIFQFSSMVKASVFAMFGIALEEEVNIIK
jgi:UDP-N-acetylmuramate dehydrogenase